MLNWMMSKQLMAFSCWVSALTLLRCSFGWLSHPPTVNISHIWAIHIEHTYIICRLPVAKWAWCTWTNKQHRFGPLRVIVPALPFLFASSSVKLLFSRSSHSPYIECRIKRLLYESAYIVHMRRVMCDDFVFWFSQIKHLIREINSIGRDKLIFVLGFWMCFELSMHPGWLASWSSKS